MPFKNRNFAPSLYRTGREEIRKVWVLPRLKFYIFFPFILMIMGCASSSIESTKVGKEMQNSRSETPEAILRDAVFSITRDQSREGAVAILTEDGATCIDTTCIWRFLEKESAWDKAGIRPPGPLRSWVLMYQVKFNSNRVENLEDIIANVSSLEVK